ncbi:MAG: T9SS type A sorting domain-containing protein [Bacteroidia bacterium]
MKKTLLILLLPYYAFSQIYTRKVSGDYSFQSFTSNFSYLSNSIPVMTDWGSSHKFYTIPLPFILPQRSNSTGASSILVSSEGRIDFYPGISFPRVDRTLLITKFDGGSVLCDRNSIVSNQKSTISYLIDSSQSANKILKLEFKNMGILNGDSNSVVNAQIWLYENGNIEIHFGKQKLKNETAFKNFGIVYDDDISQYSSSLMLKGNPLMPSTVDSKADYGLFPNPSNENMVYRFVRNLTFTNTSEINYSALEISPNPASNFIQYHLPANEVANRVSIYNTTGLTIKDFNILQMHDKTYISIDKMSRGIYYILIYTDERRYKARFIKN